MVQDLSLYIFAFIFPQRTCFGSNNRRWMGLVFLSAFGSVGSFCLSFSSWASFALFFQSFYLACTSTRGTENKSGYGPGSSFFLTSFTDH